jgi:hypothetical protein
MIQPSSDLKIKHTDKQKTKTENKQNNLPTTIKQGYKILYENKLVGVC